MKTIFLIKGLDTKELKRLEVSLKNQKRASLTKLYLFIKNNSNVEDIDKQLLYESFAADKYTPAKDYLLRNELRLLNELIEQHIINVRLARCYEPDSLGSQMLLLEHYYEGKCYQQFEKEWKTLWKRATDDANFEAIDKLSEMWILFSEQARELNLQTFQELKQILLYQLQSACSRKTEMYAYIQYRLAYVERVFKRFDPEYQMIDHQPDETAANLWGPTLLWQTYKKATHMNGQAKIDLLLQAVPIFEQIKAQRDWSFKSHESLLGTIGLEFFLLGNYTQANVFYLQAIHLRKKVPNTNLPILCNYCSVLCALAQFHQVLQLIADHETEIRQSRLKAQFQYFKIIAWINIRQADKALTQLTIEKPNNFEPEVYYHRILVALCLFELNEIDQCQRELINLAQVGRYKAPIDAAHTQTVKWLTEFLNILTSPRSPKEQKLKFQELKTEIGTPLPTTHRLFICQWLFYKIDTISSND